MAWRPAACGATAKTIRCEGGRVPAGAGSAAGHSPAWIGSRPGPGTAFQRVDGCRLRGLLADFPGEGGPRTRSGTTPDRVPLRRGHPRVDREPRGCVLGRRWAGTSGAKPPRLIPSRGGHGGGTTEGLPRQSRGRPADAPRHPSGGIRRCITGFRSIRSGSLPMGQGSTSDGSATRAPAGFRGAERTRLPAERSCSGHRAGDRVPRRCNLRHRTAAPRTFLWAGAIIPARPLPEPGWTIPSIPIAGTAACVERGLLRPGCGRKPTSPRAPGPDSAPILAGGNQGYPRRARRPIGAGSARSSARLGPAGDERGPRWRRAVQSPRNHPPGGPGSTSRLPVWLFHPHGPETAFAVPRMPGPAAVKGGRPHAGPVLRRRQGLRLTGRVWRSGRSTTPER
jgi:hypothetical protein